MAFKPLTLPDMETATRQAIETCYGALIAEDPRWIIGLPQFNVPPLRQRRKPIELVYSRSTPRNLS